MLHVVQSEFMKMVGDDHIDDFTLTELFVCVDN